MVAPPVKTQTAQPLPSPEALSAIAVNSAVKNSELNDFGLTSDLQANDNAPALLAEPDDRRAVGGAGPESQPLFAPLAPQTTLAVVDGWPINLATPDDAVREIIRAARQGHSFAVCTLNLDHLVKLRSLPAFRAAYGSAHFVTADGAPVAALAKRQYPAIVRTTGADLLVPLSQAAAKYDLPVYFFGSTEETARRTAQALAARCDKNLIIAGTGAPGSSFDPAGVDADAAIERIRASGARLCFLALGATKQEIFAARAVAKGVNCGFLSIGAGFDFIAGVQKRAPIALQNAGLEWAWRLSCNPRRMALRYAQCAVLLAEIAVRSALKPRHN